MVQASGAVVSLAASLKKSRAEVRKVSKERDEFRLKGVQADGADEGWSTLAKKVAEEIHTLLAQARDAVLQLKMDHEEQLAVEKRRNDPLNAQVTDFTGQLMNVKELYLYMLKREDGLGESKNAERTAMQYARLSAHFAPRNA